MKRKFVDSENYRKVTEPETKISFGTASPFPALNFPSDKTKFVAWYGNTSFGSGVSIAIGPQKPDYHWAGGLPEHLQDNAPNWVKEIIKNTSAFNSLPILALRILGSGSTSASSV